MINFIIREQKNSFRKEPMFIARIVRSGKVSYKQFCKDLAEASTVETADVKAVIDRMTSVLHRYCSLGLAVDAGELGTFYPSMRTKAVTTPSEFDAKKHILKPRIVFRPRQNWSKLADVKFRRISDKSQLEEDTETTDTDTTDTTDTDDNHDLGL